ncbi:hypothetical protein [Novosphingobium terrae]|uniref:hypothetical protein n=1 Tax=Novosphingobium terrae TaxID=2726189 RepID=UPI0019803A89|nr:hypothetical protein [Novosphingobium terrae]
MVAKIIQQLQDILDLLDKRKIDIPALHIATAIELLQNDFNNSREGGKGAE